MVEEVKLRAIMLRDFLINIHVVVSGIVDKVENMIKDCVSYRFDVGVG